MKIGLLGPYGYGNLGDAAIQMAVIQNIRVRCPGAEILGFSLNPQDTMERHNIVSYPISRSCGIHQSTSSSLTLEKPLGPGVSTKGYSVRCAKSIPALYPLLKRIHGILLRGKPAIEEYQFLKRSLEILKSFDLLIVSGGGQLDDFWGGAWGHPYSLFKWAILARISRTRLFVLSVGAGPLNSGLSRFFIKWSLRLAQYRSFRDEASTRLVESIGVKGDHRVFPDLAYSLNVSKLRAPSVRLAGRLVAISPMSYCDPRIWPEKDSSAYQCYLGKLAEFALWLTQKGYTVWLFSSQVRMDPPVIADLKALLNRSHSPDLKDLIAEKPIASVDELVSILASTRVVVASRLHGVLLSHLVHTPVLAISYHPKIDSLMESLGQSEYCMDIHKFDLASLQARFTELEFNYEPIRERIRMKVSEYQSSLRIQFDYLFT